MTNKSVFNYLNQSEIKKNFFKINLVNYFTLFLFFFFTCCSGDVFISSPQSQIEKKRREFGVLGGAEIKFPKNEKNKRNTVHCPDLTGVVNPYLWQSALETVAFMQIIKANPASGIIETDWYIPNQKNSRVKVWMLISGHSIENAFINIIVTREKRSTAGIFVKEPITFKQRNEIIALIRSQAYLIEKDLNLDKTKSIAGILF